MPNDTTYYIEIAISFIIIFILLYIAIQIRKSSITFDSYYKMKKKNLEDMSIKRNQYNEELENAKHSRSVVAREYAESYTQQTRKITDTLVELKGFNDGVVQKNIKNDGGDADDN